MGGKPRKTPVRRRPSNICVCGHKKALHLDGLRCQYLAEWKNPDSTWVSTTVCICQNFKSKSEEKILTKEAVTIPNEQTP